MMCYNFKQNSREMASSQYENGYFSKKSSLVFSFFSSSDFERNNGFFKFYDDIAISRKFSVK